MFKVYYTDSNNVANSLDFGDSDMKLALDTMQDLRNRNFSFVTMVSENPESIGKPGVDSVKNGLTPDGIPYTWNKSSRIGAMKR